MVFQIERGVALECQHRTLNRYRTLKNLVLEAATFWSERPFSICGSPILDLHEFRPPVLSETASGSVRTRAHLNEGSMEKQASGRWLGISPKL